MPVLYYRDPADGSWKPFATTDVVVANEVEVSYVPPVAEGIEIWVDPAESGQDGGGWALMDQRYVRVIGDAMSGPLTLPGAPNPSSPQHATTKSYVDAAITAALNAINPIPVGLVAIYGGSVAPPGWRLCDGSAHGSSALQTVLGSANTPDLRDRFVIGAGGAHAKGATGGAATVTLSAAQSGMPSHGHAASSGTVSADHYHGVGAVGGSSEWANTAHQHYLPPNHHWSFTGGAHDHGVVINEGTWIADIDGVFLDTVRDQQSGEKNISARTSGGGHEHATDVGDQWTDARGNDHVHGFTVPAHNTGGISANHTHTITVVAASAVAASAAHENQPPFYALIYIIKA